MTQENQNKTKDILGAYPEKQQVDAFPERRYVRLTRFLAIFSLINLAFVIASAGLYFYMVRHRDITISKNNWIHLYTIDPEKKQLLPSERGQSAVSAKQLVIEDALRKYLTLRYESIWDEDTMRKRWGDGYVSHLSSPEVQAKFKDETARSWNEIAQKRITRDVHIYTLEPVHGDLWRAYIETFDFPLDENLVKTCDCTDNSYECLTCKEKNMVPGGRRRTKILLRVNFDGQKTLENPFGIMVYAYYPAFVPMPTGTLKDETFWNLPPPLRPPL